MVCGYVLFFLLDIKTENRLAGDHYMEKWLSTWLSLVMSLIMPYFVLSFFPRDVLDEIWD